MNTTATPPSDDVQILTKDHLRPISGFLEYLPAVELQRLKRMTALRALFEGYGYLALNTPEVERIDVLTSKSGEQDVDKEMYVLDRITRDESTEHTLKMGLRFDLTVPLARYVAAYGGELTFPFRRYHMGSCYRGERPQDGRFRQFMQCDIDIIGNGSLALEADVEVAEVGLKGLEAMGLTNYTFRISNRKLLQGVLDALGIEKSGHATRALDKLQKIGAEKTLAMLRDSAQLDVAIAEKLLRLGSVKTTQVAEVRATLAELSLSNPKITEGLMELEMVFSNLARVSIDPSSRVVMDLGVIRGLDYYTGSIYEVTWESHRNIGSIAAGGRYDNLASRFSRQPYPGVGFSLGFSRMFDKLASTGGIAIGSASPSTVMVARLLEDGGVEARAIAAQLRSRGINAEIYLGADKLGKQMKFASKLGIPYVVFDIDRKVKNMATGDQSAEGIDMTSWMPGC